eukprot:356118-Chlamydomonas_euryale.AAC.4
MRRSCKIGWLDGWMDGWMDGLVCVCSRYCPLQPATVQRSIATRSNRHHRMGSNVSSHASLNWAGPPHPPGGPHVWPCGPCVGAKAALQPAAPPPWRHHVRSFQQSGALRPSWQSRSSTSGWGGRGGGANLLESISLVFLTRTCPSLLPDGCNFLPDGCTGWHHLLLHGREQPRDNGADAAGEARVQNQGEEDTRAGKRWRRKEGLNMCFCLFWQVTNALPQ